jgi:hypothetical protein
LSLAFVAAGCSGGNRAAVRGKVTLDGQPIEQGRINFYPVEDNTGPSAGSAILNGSYDVPASNGAVVGKNRVEINGLKKTGRKVASAYRKGELIDEVAESVPRKYYGEKSELTREIKRGVNQFDFDLKTQ